MNSPHVVIIGSALSGNKGAAAMLEAALQTLRERLDSPRFTLLSMYPVEDAAQNTHDDLQVLPADPRRLGVDINVLALAYRIAPFLRPVLRSRSRVMRALADADVLLDQGGITFTDGREKFLLYNIASILPALNTGTPVFKCAQAIGPFENPVNRRAARLFLPKVRTIVTRGRLTQEFADGLGLTNTVAGADFAFSLDLDGTEAAAVSAEIDLSFFDSDVVGVCPSVVLQRKVDGRGGDYVGQIVDFVERVRASGRRVMLIPHSVRTGTEKTHNNDLPLCREIHSRLRLGEDLLFVDRELSSQQLRYLIGLCRIFVASRFHAMVSSLAMGVPTLVIGWSHKYKEVLEMFGQEEWAFGHDRLTPDLLFSSYESLSAQRESVKTQLDTALPEVKSRSLMQADLIADIVRESGRG